jgi:hypothetical protein
MSSSDRKRKNMRGFIVKCFVLTIFLISLLACGCGPKPVFKVRQGFDVYCDGLCYSKYEIEQAIDATVYELAKAIPEKYSVEKIEKFFEEQDGWHDIEIVEAKEGVCENNPEKKCRGFECPYSPSGWCGGLHIIYVMRGFDFSKVKVARFADCPASSALVHEFIHFFHHYFEGGLADYEHVRYPEWPTSCIKEDRPEGESLTEEEVECVKNSVQRKANWILCQECCGDLCKEN